MFAVAASYQRGVKEGKTAAKHSAPSSAATAAPGTSASSPSSATARRRSGTWPASTSPRPPRSLTSTTPGEHVHELANLAARLLTGHRDEWLAARLADLDTGDIDALLA